MGPMTAAGRWVSGWTPMLCSLQDGFPISVMPSRQVISYLDLHREGQEREPMRGQHFPGPALSCVSGMMNQRRLL